MACSGAAGPDSSHHASAAASKRAISSGSAAGGGGPCLSSGRLAGRESKALYRAAGGGARGGRPVARIVQKFGGTSVAGLDRVRNAARRVQAAVAAGDRVAVVVSAMAGETDRLDALTRGVSRMHDAREYDAVVASGEQASAGLMALALQDLGVAARSWLAWQLPDPHRWRARARAHRGHRRRRDRRAHGGGRGGGGRRVPGPEPAAAPHHAGARRLRRLGGGAGGGARRRALRHLHRRRRGVHLRPPDRRPGPQA